MNKMVKSSLCGGLSLLLAFMLIVPIVATVAYGAEKNTNPVIISNVPGDSKISIGKGEDVGVGAKGVIVRDGRDIAKFEVTSVEWGYSRIKVSDMAPGETLRIGDTAPLTSRGQTHAKIKKNNTAAKALLALLVVGTVVALSNHHGGGGAQGVSANSISVTSNDTSLPADGKSTTVITATVSNGNNAAVPDGTAVQFSTSAGSITPAQAKTSGGKATATLTAGTTPGTVTVTATVGGKTSTVTLSFVQSSTTTQGSILLSASPMSIQVLGSGGSQTQSVITATCRDAHGNLVVGGTVTFTSTLGSVTGTAQTDGNGVATSTFSSSATGQAQITASLSGATATIPVSVTAGPPYAISISCSPQAIECDGQSFATVTATVRDIAGNMATDGTVVSFSVQPDANGGGNGTITPQGRTSGGIATATLFSRTASGSASNPGTATIVAQVLISQQPAGIPAPSTDLQNHSTQVQFVSQDVAQIAVDAQPTNIRDDLSGNTSAIDAMVYDSHHNPVPDGTAVYFTSTQGLIYGADGTSNNVALCLTHLGVAHATLVTDGFYGTTVGGQPQGGNVSITATCGGKSFTGGIIFSGWPSKTTSSATMAPTSLHSVQDASTITVVVHDTLGDPVVDGTAVTATATKGTLSGGSGKTLGGIVQFTLTTSTNATSPTALGPGTINITIDSGGHNPETSGQPVTYTLSYTVVP